jgi:integrase
MLLAFMRQVNDTKGKATPTFGVLAGEWLKWITPRRVEPRHEARQVELLQGLAEETQESLTAIKVEEHLEGLRRELGHGATYSNKVRDTGLKILAFGQRRERWGGVNQFALSERAKQLRRVFEMLTLEELGRVQYSLPVYRRALFRVSLHLGMRPGEIFALRKEDVDLTRRVIQVRRSHGRNKTKTGIVRLVPIVPAVELEFAEAMAGKNDLLFPARSGERQPRRSSLSKLLRRHLVAVGVSPQRAGRVRWYDLRHLAATFHHAAKADPLCVALALGHAVSGTTHSIYTHPSIEMIREELSRWHLPR